MMILALFIAVTIVTASANPLFYENFDDGLDGWVISQARDDFGKWVVKDGGIATSDDARFYSIATTFPEFSNENKDLVVHLSVKHPQNIDCGGGYIKLLPAGIDLTKFDGNTEYNIMFGPDICGPPTKKIHFIHHYGKDNHLWEKTPAAKTDTLSHLYSFTLKPDNSYTVSVDGAQVESGSLENDWKLLPPKMINDPKESKPKDWVDQKKIDDPSDVKPADWDNEPAQIADPDAKKPEDWDTELDGEWEAPLIDNPKYKGAWKAKKIDNPAYKGEWVHPQIPNPEYHEDKNLYKYKSFGGVGIDIWQVKSGTVFDDIYISSDIEAANKWVEEVFKPKAAAEKEAHDKEEAEKAAKAAEAAPVEDGDDDDDDGDEEDHSGHGHGDEL